MEDSTEAKRSKTFSWMGKRDLKKQNIGMLKRNMITLMQIVRTKLMVIELLIEESMIELNVDPFCSAIKAEENVGGRSRLLSSYTPPVIILKSSI